MYKYVEGFLSLIYPSRCVACDDELPTSFRFLCPPCLSTLHYTYFEKYKEETAVDQIFFGRVYFERVYSMLYFQKGSSSQKILHTIKYNNGKQLGVFMGEKLGDRMKEITEFQSVDALIPIPIHPKKKFIRGYNQSLKIAQGISRSTNIPIVKAIFRTRNDESQTHKSKEERYQNVKGKFEAFPHVLKSKKHAIIVDDVLTTGATLEFAAKAIQQKYPNIKLSVVTIAYSSDI